MTATKVLLVCQWYRPEPVSQPGWLVDGLRRQGLEVEVLTGIPNYPDGKIVAPYRASRGVSEFLSGVRVRRAPLYPSHDRRALGRILNYLSWALAATVWGWRELRRAEVSLVYSSPATAAIPAMVGRRLFGTPYVLLIQDVWPDSVFASGFLGGPRQRFVERAIDLFVQRSYRQAAHIVVTSPGMIELLVDRGVAREKVSVVHNWIVEDADSGMDSPDLRTTLGVGADDFTVMYAGNHGPAQALETAVDAFAAANPVERAAHLILVGDGIDKAQLRERAAARGTNRVHFLDPVPRAQMPGLMAQVDAQLVSLARRPLFAVTTPSKLQSVLAAGMPVLAAADGDVAQIVRAAGAGAAVAAEDVDALTHAVETMASAPAAQLEAMASNGRAYYDATMAEGVGAARLAEHLTTAAAERTERAQT